MVQERVRLPNTRRALLDGLALFLLALLVRLVAFDREPLWQDELFSFYWSQLTPGFMLGTGAHIEPTPPTYYILLHAWMRLVGASAITARLPSVIFSAATAPVVYAIGRQLLDRRTALLAGVFAALDALAVMYAQEARSYALFALLDGLALLALAGYLRRRGTAGPVPWVWLAAFVAASIATSLVHFTSVFFVAACFGAVAVDLAFTRPRPVREGLAWAVAGLVVLIGAAWPLTLAASLASAPGLSWIEPLTPWIVRIFFMELLTHPGISANTLMIVVAAALVLLAVSPFLRFRPDRAQLMVLLLIPALFCLVLIGVSARRPLLLARVGVWLITPLCLLLAMATTVQRNRMGRAATATVTLGLLVFGLSHYFLFIHKEDWPAAAHLAATDPRCGGPIVFGSAYGLGLVFYDPALAGRPIYAVPMGDGDRSSSEFVLAEQVIHPHLLPPDELGAFAAAHPHTAVIVRDPLLKRGLRPISDLLAHAPFHQSLVGDISVFCL